MRSANLKHMHRTAVVTVLMTVSSVTATAGGRASTPSKLDAAVQRAVESMSTLYNTSFVAAVYGEDGDTHAPFLSTYAGGYADRAGKVSKHCQHGLSLVSCSAVGQRLNRAASLRSYTRWRSRYDHASDSRVSGLTPVHAIRCP